MSFDCDKLLDSSILFLNLFCNRDIKSTSMEISRWSDGDTWLNAVIPQARIYLYMFGEVKLKSILFEPLWYVFGICYNPCVHAIGSTSLVIDINFATPPFPYSNYSFASIVNIIIWLSICNLLIQSIRSSIILDLTSIFFSPLFSSMSDYWQNAVFGPAFLIVVVQTL